VPEIERSIEAKFPAKEIAEVIERPESIPNWNPYIEKVGNTKAARQRGGQLRWIARFSGVEIAGKSEVRRWTSGRIYEWASRADGAGLTLIGTLELDESDRCDENRGAPSLRGTERNQHRH
jgi:uncharacterized membrane protein